MVEIQQDGIGDSDDSEHLGVKKTKLGFIPYEWDVKELQEIVEFLNNRRKPIKEEERKKGTYPYYGASGVIDYIDDYLFDGEFILLGEDGANILTRVTPLAFIAKGKIWVNNHAHVMKPKTISDINFITYYLESINYEKYNASTAQPKITQEACRRIPIPLPNNKRETEKIGKVISTWEKAIDLKEKLIEQKKGLMQKLLTGEVRLPGFDGEWEKIKIKDFCTTYSGGTPSRARKEFFENATIPWIKSGELNNRKVVSTEEYITKLALESSSAKIVYPNTVLIALYGATAGVVAINKIEASINQAILAVVPKGECENDFLFYFLESIMPDVVKKYTQGGQPNLNAEIVKNLILELPTTKEQRVIAKVISTLDDEITLLTKVFEEYRNQKKGLMQNLLTGKVRVKV